MKLTYDTLLHVISLTGYAKESVQLVATCRILYHEGAKIALKKPVTIYNEEQLASFLQFLRTENLSRCRFLRQLDLWALEPESEHVQELIDVGAPIRSSPARQRPVLYPYVIISAQTPADPYFLVLHMFFTCLILRSIPLLCHTLPHVTDFVHFHQRLCHAVQYSFLFRYPPVQPY